MNFNKVIFGGRLTRDVELKSTVSGLAIARFAIASNFRSGDKEKTTFIDVMAFGKTADLIAKYFFKGKEILIEGRLENETWTDKQTGDKRSKLGVIAESFEFCGLENNTTRQPATGTAPPRQPQQPSQPRQSPSPGSVKVSPPPVQAQEPETTAPTEQPNEPGESQTLDPDDIPF